MDGSSFFFFSFDWILLDSLGFSWMREKRETGKSQGLLCVKCLGNIYSCIKLCVSTSILRIIALFVNCVSNLLLVNQLNSQSISLSICLSINKSMNWTGIHLIIFSSSFKYILYYMTTGHNNGSWQQVMTTGHDNRSWQRFARNLHLLATATGSLFVR